MSSTSQPVDLCLGYRLDVKSLLDDLRDQDRTTQKNALKCLIEGVKLVWNETYSRYTENIDGDEKKNLNKDAINDFLEMFDDNFRLIPNQSYDKLIGFIIDKFLLDKYFNVNLSYYKKTPTVFTRDILERKSLAIECLSSILKAEVSKMQELGKYRKDKDTINEICQQTIEEMILRSKFSATYIFKKTKNLEPELNNASPIKYALGIARKKVIDLSRYDKSHPREPFPELPPNDEKRGDDDNDFGNDEDILPKIEGEELIFNNDEKVGKDSEKHRKNEALKNCRTNALTPRQREVMQLKYDEGMDYEEIAGIMNISVEAVRNHHYDGIARLTECMNNKGFNR